MNARDKKGQITIFIIIALVLIIGGGVIIYLTTIKEVVKIEEIVYPQEVQTISNYVTQCAQDAAKEAIIILGSQGGFIEFPPEIEFERASYLRMDNFGLYKIPYWVFQRKSRIPPIDYIQFQLNGFTKERTLECIDNFKAFEQQFTITPLEEMKVVSILTEGDVLFEIMYPLEIKTKDKEFNVEKFNFFVPVRLKQIYELAVKILAAENRESFFENTTIDIMASDPDIPMDGMIVSCIPKQWYIPKIKESLQRNLQFNIAKTRIKNTGYPPFSQDLDVYEDLGEVYEDMIDDFSKGMSDYKEKSKYVDAQKTKPVDAWEYFHLFFDVGADPTDLKATFEYDPRYGMDLMVKPSDGQILSTKNMEGQGVIAALFCMRQYHFTYDVRYPIKVTIRDPRAFKGEGYNFFYSFPIFIDDNQPARAFSSSDSFPDLTDELSFCQFLGDETYEFRAQGYFAEGAPPGDIKEVTINYRCFRQSCILGETDAVRGVYRLVTPLPEGCTNPLIIAEKEGYLKDQKFLTDKYMTLNLIKLKNFTYEVVKHSYNAETDTLATEEDPLKTTEFKDEKAIIILKLKGDRKHCTGGERQ